MSCRVKFTFIRGPCLGKEIVHDFDEAATVADMKQFLTEKHHACDHALQSLVFVWDEQGKKLNDEDQSASSLGRNISITVNVKKRDAVSTPTSDMTPSVNSDSSPMALLTPKSDLAPSVNSDSTPSAVQASSVELKSYKIRLRKLDNQSVVINGTLPATASLQNLADEIVKLGHASADSFSFVLPPLQGRAPTVYDPKDFAASLRTLDVFDKPISVSLQKFGQVEPATSGAGKQLGAAAPFPHKVPVPKDFERHIESSAIRRAAELALPLHQDHWGKRRFCQGTLEEEKKGCIKYFEVHEREMTELLHNIWRGSTWPDASESNRRVCVQNGSS
jgi:hypothetical protein